MMKKAKARSTNVTAYIHSFPPEIRRSLKNIRQTIRSAAPEAEECISYGMPAYRHHGMLVYFAAFKNHTGFYPTARGIAAFQKELSAWEGSKGTVRFPHDEPLPLELIRKIVKFRVKENESGKNKKNTQQKPRSK